MNKVSRSIAIALVSAFSVSIATYVIVNEQETYYRSSIIISNPSTSSKGSLLKSLVGSEVDSITFLKNIIFSYDAKIKLLKYSQFLGDDFEKEVSKLGYDTVIENFDDYIILKQPYGSQDTIEIITTCNEPQACKLRLSQVIQFIELESATFLKLYLENSIAKYKINPNNNMLLQGSVNMRGRILEDYFNFSYNLNHLTVIKSPFAPIQPAGPRPRLASAIAFAIILNFFILYALYRRLKNKKTRE